MLIWLPYKLVCFQLRDIYFTPDRSVLTVLYNKIHGGSLLIQVDKWMLMYFSKI